MKKRLIALLLLILCFSLFVGCENPLLKNDESTSDNSSANTTCEHDDLERISNLNESTARYKCKNCGEPDPDAPVLMGDFRLRADDTLSAAPGENGFGYWNGKGYPVFSGDGVYETAFTYEGSGRLELLVETKDTVEALLNGESVGIRYSAPYTFDLTAYARKGENALTLRVTSTLSNFIYKSSLSGVLDAHLFFKK